MDFEFDCPACGQPITSPVEYVGCEGECATCHHAFLIPEPPTASNAVSPATSGEQTGRPDPAAGLQPRSEDSGTLSTHPGRPPARHRPKPVVAFAPGAGDPISLDSPSEEPSRNSEPASASLVEAPEAPPKPARHAVPSALGNPFAPRSEGNPRAPFPPRDVTTALGSESVASLAHRTRVPFPAKDHGASAASNDAPAEATSHASPATSGATANPKAQSAPQAADSKKAIFVKAKPIVGAAPARAGAASPTARVKASPVRDPKAPLAPPPSTRRGKEARRSVSVQRLVIFGLVGALIAGGILAVLGYQHRMREAEAEFRAVAYDAEQARAKLASQISYRTDLVALAHNVAAVKAVCDAFEKCRALPFAVSHVPTLFQTDQSEAQGQLHALQNAFSKLETSPQPLDVSGRQQIGKARAALVTYAERFAPAEYTIDTTPPDDHWTTPDLNEASEKAGVGAAGLIFQHERLERKALIEDLEKAKRRLTELDIEKYLALGEEAPHLNTVFNERLIHLKPHAEKMQEFVKSAAHRQYADDFAHRRAPQVGAFFLGAGAPEVTEQVAQEIHQSLDELKDASSSIPAEDQNFEVQCRAWRQIQWIIYGFHPELPSSEKESFETAYDELTGIVKPDYVAILKAMGGYVRFDGEG